MKGRHAKLAYGIGDHRKCERRPWLAMLVIAIALTAIVGAFTSPVGASTMHRSQRCEHETVGHVYYRQCESRHGDWITYTFTRIVRVHV